MNKPQPTPKNTEKAEELKTQSPVSEKDEVKAAELKATQLHKKAAQAAKNNKK